MNILYKHAKKPKNNKSWELQIEWCRPSIRNEFFLSFKISQYFGILIDVFSIFEFSIKRTTEEDHAGITFMFQILGFFIYYTYHDIRHWDYENGKWEEYN